MNQVLEFINLHGHCMHSHDSASRIDKLVKYVSTLNQSSLAISDHGNMSAAIKFQKECQKYNIKSIQGCEFYICPPEHSSLDRSASNKKLNHLVVLAKNKIGYQNLLKLVYLSNKPERLYYKPRIDEELLFSHSEGLIVLNGHHTTSIWDQLMFNVGQVEKCDTVDEARDYLFPDWEDRVKKIADRYRSIFKDDFYIECQLFDKQDVSQQLTGTVLWEFAQKYNFQAVGSSDHHYIEPKDAKAHKTFVAIKQNGKVKDLPNIRYFTGEDYCVVTNEKAAVCYPEQLILATQEIAAKVENYEITGPQRIPSFTPAKEESLKIVRDCVYKKLADIGRGDDQEYLERVKYELEMTEKGDLQDYFLIVKDYLDWARSKGILTGCGRGCLANTNIILKNGKIKDISEIKIGDKVICKSGNINKVINTFEYNVNEELINIVTNFGESKGITLTKDHKVLACQRSVKYMCGKKKYYDTEFNTTPEWIPASELKIGDFLVQPKINLKEIIPTFDLANFSISIKNGSKVTFDDNFVYSRLNGNKFRKSQVLKSKRYLNITEEFCYVLGIFIGDGWLSKNKTMISFCFNSKTNIDSQNRVINFMESIGCRSHVDLNQNGKNVNQVHFVNLAIYQLFRKIFSSYDYTPKSKCIPRFIFNLPDLHKTCLLNGIIDSDGSNDGSKISICTTSKKLANHIKYLTQSLNIPCGMSSELRIEKRKEFGVKSRAYYCRLPIFNNKLIKEYAYRSFKNHNLVKIRKINKVNDIKKVYDFHVENENDYLTTSGIVHNSVGGALIAYLLGITTIDSIKYNLMWDRFMGPDRIENKVLADIDSDFQTSRTQDVIDYITQKYGADKVCGVVTFGLLQGKSAIKAVLSAWGVLDHKQQKDISDRIQSKDKISDKLADFKEETGSDSIILYTLTHDPKALASYVNLVDGKIEGELAPFFELAIELEGSIKTESRHASALIISDRPVYEVAPMIKSKTEDCLLCALDMYSFEQAGLVKFDILSLKNLDGLAQVNSLLKNYDLKKLEKL